MCIPHGAGGTKSNGFVKKSRPAKSIKRVSQDEFEKGDPNFIDERTKAYVPKKKASFFNSLFKWYIIPSPNSKITLFNFTLTRLLL